MQMALPSDSWQIPYPQDEREHAGGESGFTTPRTVTLTLIWSWRSMIRIRDIGKMYGQGMFILTQAGSSRFGVDD